MDLQPLFKAIATPAELHGVVTNGVATNGVATNGVATNGVATNGVATNGVATNGVATSARSIRTLATASVDRQLSGDPVQEPAKEPVEEPVESSTESRSIDRTLISRELTENLSGQPVSTSCEKSFSSKSFSDSTAVSKATSRASTLQTTLPRAGHWKFFGASVNQDLKIDEVVKKIDSGQLWVVNSRRRNGLIVVREFHAEFAGPGAAVGGDLDEGILEVIPIGNLSLLEPDSHEAHQNAIKIRLQWIRLTQNFTDQPSPDDRARMILEQFKTYFDQDTVDLVSDEAFALLVGVLPQTIRRVRSGFVW
jgi:hypothetical protein